MNWLLTNPTALTNQLVSWAHLPKLSDCIVSVLQIGLCAMIFIRLCWTADAICWKKTADFMCGWLCHLQVSIYRLVVSCAFNVRYEIVQETRYVVLS